MDFAAIAGMHLPPASESLATELPKRREIASSGATSRQFQPTIFNLASLCFSDQPLQESLGPWRSHQLIPFALLDFFEHNLRDFTLLLIREQPKHIKSLPKFIY